MMTLTPNDTITQPVDLIMPLQRGATTSRGIALPTTAQVEIFSAEPTDEELAEIFEPDLSRLTKAQDDAIEGYKRLILAGRRGGLISAPTGCGKSRVGAILSEWVIDTFGGQCLWLTQVGAKRNQLAEFLKWTSIPRENIVVIDGDATTRLGLLTQAILKQASVIITNYDDESDHVEIYQNIFADPNKSIVVTDEADIIQNWDSHVSVNVRALEKRVGFAMTATPVSNRSDSMYPLLAFCDPGKPYLLKGIRHHHDSPIWGSRKEYEDEFCIVEDGRVVGSYNIPELHRRLKKFGMIEWDKYELLGIDPPEEHIVKLTPSEAQREWITLNVNGAVEVVREMQDSMDDDPAYTLESPGFLAILTRVRYACSVSPATDVKHLYDGKLPEIPIDITQVKITDDNIKADWIQDFCAEHWQEGVFIWSQWEEPLKDIRRKLGDLYDQAGGMTLDSSVPSKKRSGPGSIQEAVLRKQCKILLSSPAGAAALNFHTLKYIIVVDQTYRPRDVIQAIGRIERAGMEKRQAVVYYLCIDESIETAKMIPMNQEKSADARQIVTGQRGRRARAMFSGFDEVINALRGISPAQKSR